MLELLLHKLPPQSVRGSYDVNSNNVSDDYLPRRMLFVHPDVAESIMGMTDATIVLSDLFRSAEASLAAIAKKRGVKPPAYSGHNFGVSFDVDVERTLHANNWTYRDLLNYMEHKQWYCHRRDGSRGSEDWHFNFLGPEPREILSQIDPRPWLGRSTWANAAELAIQKRYGGSFALSDQDIQRCLQKLRMYSGDVDGKLGAVSQAAIGLFAKTWNLPSDARSPKFQRVLAYVGANVNITNEKGATAWVS